MTKVHLSTERVRRFQEARDEVWRYAKKMWQSGLVVASSGNVSARIPDDTAIAVTPTSVPYADMTPSDVVVVDLATGHTLEGDNGPSTELPLHLAVYRARTDVGGVMHTHGPAVTALSILRRPLPPVIDEMVVYFGGTVEISEYAFTGTTELAGNAVAALGDRAAVILANHGNVCVGSSLDDALHVALTMESAARSYLDALRSGDPHELPKESIDAGRAIYERRKRILQTTKNG